jgi:tetratricopeptide (TPR) repeat protein
VSEPGYEILSLDDLERFPSATSSHVLRPLRRRLGFRPFGLNVWEGEQAGDQVIERHSERDGTEELYVVVRGSVRFTLGEETFAAPAGTLVHAPPGTLREATAIDAGSLVLAMGAKAGEAYEPAGWEDFFIAFAHLDAGEAERGRTVYREAIAREPNAWQGAYNAACFEARAGEVDAALEQLRRAVRLDRAQVRPYLGTDSDLDALRGDSRFEELAR